MDQKSKELASVKQKGYDYKLYKTTVGGKEITKVLIGPFEKADIAAELAKIRKDIAKDAFSFTLKWEFLAVIGDPISHSKSPRMHNNAIKALGLDSIYTRYHLRNANCLREDFFKLGLSGANITLPFKEKALDIADVKDDFARNIGSANTLCLKEDKIYAYNTDALGF